MGILDHNYFVSKKIYAVVRLQIDDISCPPFHSDVLYGSPLTVTQVSQAVRFQFGDLSKEQTTTRMTRPALSVPPPSPLLDVVIGSKICYLIHTSRTDRLASRA